MIVSCNAPYCIIMRYITPHYTLSNYITLHFITHHTTSHCTASVPSDSEDASGNMPSSPPTSLAATYPGAVMMTDLDCTTCWIRAE